MSDVCNEPVTTGPCTDWQTKYYFNTASQACEPFTYGGCDGTGNRFSDLFECQTVCLAGREPRVGSAKGNIYSGRVSTWGSPWSRWANWFFSCVSRNLPAAGGDGPLQWTFGARAPLVLRRRSRKLCVLHIRRLLRQPEQLPILRGMHEPMPT